MDPKDRVMIDAALVLLRAVHKDTIDSRNRSRWQIAIKRIVDTRREIDADEAAAAIRSGAVPYPKHPLRDDLR
jgi:hypothetical protein